MQIAGGFQLLRGGGRIGVGRRMGVRACLALTVVLLVQNTATGATWYVRTSGSDSNSGASPASAYKTIGKAEDMVAPGDTVYVAAGTYQERVKIEQSGSAGAYISFIADTSGQHAGPAGAVIVSGSGSANRGFELKKNTSYVRVQGFQVTGFTKEGIKARDVDHVVIDGCRVYDNKKGVDLKGQSCVVSGCYVYSNTDRGIKFDGQNTGSTLNGCVVHSNGKDGIEIKGFGSDDGDDDDDDGSVCNASVHNCLVYENGKQGIKISGKSTAVGLYNNTVALNGKDGVNVKKKGTILLINNILAYNGGNGIKQAKGTVVSNYNLMWQNAKGDYGGASAGLYDISDDPLFANLAGRDFRLSSTSPARGAGELTGAPDTDFQGQSRAADGLVDIGADEFGTPIRVLLWQEVRR